MAGPVASVFGTGMTATVVILLHLELARASCTMWPGGCAVGSAPSKLAAEATTLGGRAWSAITARNQQRDSAPLVIGSTNAITVAVVRSA